MRVTDAFASACPVIIFFSFLYLHLILRAQVAARTPAVLADLFLSLALFALLNEFVVPLLTILSARQRRRRSWEVSLAERTIRTKPLLAYPLEPHSLLALFDILVVLLLAFRPANSLRRWCWCLFWYRGWRWSWVCRVCWARRRRLSWRWSWLRRRCRRGFRRWIWRRVRCRSSRADCDRLPLSSVATRYGVHSVMTTVIVTNSAVHSFTASQVIAPITLAVESMDAQSLSTHSTGVRVTNKLVTRTRLTPWHAHAR